uniref:C2H2-type domain-containing protein n=1 Tax=Timema cristinae TaxID=61476 RepID=A0A7R9DDQ1_TIMCR|nr:unnamed protein product [Timema cristinae]
MIFLCKNCSKSFIKLTNKARHMRLQHGSGLKKCDECGQVFSRSENLQRHVSSHSREVKSFECDKCSQIFSRRDNLLQHKLKNCNATGATSLGSVANVSKSREQESIENLDNDEDYDTVLQQL